MSVLLDAGPTLNFLAVGQQTVLIAVADKGGLPADGAAAG